MELTFDTYKNYNLGAFQYENEFMNAFEEYFESTFEKEIKKLSTKDYTK